jgi:hypothetical protein
LESSWLSRLRGVGAKVSVGYEERFLPTSLSAGCGFRKETIAGMRRNGRDAPIPDLRGAAIEPLESTHCRPSSARQRMVGSAVKRTFAPDFYT